MQGAAFWGSKIWNFEIWPLLANWRWHCRQWYFTPPNTPPVLRPHPNCQCSTTLQKAVCTPRNVHCWSDWSFACCKTVEDPYVQLLFYWQLQFSVLHYIYVFPNSAWNLVIWFSEKIFKFVASSCQIFRLKCTKFNFCWGYAPDPAWGAKSTPHF